MQTGSCPTNQVSGAAAGVLSAAATVGNAVAVLIFANANVAVSLTSPMGQFELIDAVPTSGGSWQWWVCTNVTGASTTLTITGAGWSATAIEVSGGVGAANLVGAGTGTTSPASQAVSGLVSGELVVVGMTFSLLSGSLATSPSSPWTAFNPAGGNGAGDLAYQVLSGTSGTATWTWSGATGLSWATMALALAHEAPPAPTLLTPANSSYQDVASGQAFSATYNPALGDNMGAYAMRIKVSGGTYNYWNAGTNALQSTIVWNADTVVPNATFGPTLPNTAISDGNVYNWSFACEDATYGGQGPFAIDFTFTSQAVPSVTVTAPSGTISTTTQPTVAWTATVPGGAAQITYSVVVESGAFGSTPGSGTQVWASGTITTGLNSVQIGTPLLTSTSYRAFVQIAETGGQLSAWGFTTFTITTDVPAPPVVIAAPSTDPTTGCPVIAVEVLGLDNYLSSADSSFETGIGTAVGTNCTPTQSTTFALDGTHSLKLTPTAAGTMSAKLGPYTAVPGEQINAFAAFHGGISARTCTVGIQWIGGAGTVTSTGTADATGAWTQATSGSQPPAGLIATGTAPSGTTGYNIILTVAATSGATDVHYVDCVATKPFNTSTTGDTTWTIGGFVGVSTAVILRSDNVYVRWASVANPLPIPAVGQLATVYDYEAIPGVEYTYTAYVQQASVPLQSSPTTSAQAEVPTGLGWWELNPLLGTATTNPSAINAQMVAWTPIQTEQATANQVLSQPVMNVVASAMMNQDFSGTAETFNDAIYNAFNALLVGQATVFISSPWGKIDSGYFRIGPQSGGMSSGMGTTAKNTTLMPSVAGSGHRTTAITAVAQQRPTV